MHSPTTPPPPADGHTPADGAGGDGHAAAPVAGKPPPSLRQRLNHLINHYSPSELCGLLVRAPSSYQALGAALVAVPPPAAPCEHRCRATADATRTRHRLL